MADAGEKPDDPSEPVGKPAGPARAPAERRRNADRSASTRTQILEATIRALTEFGYGAVTNHLVAELAGVSRGAMMHHFRTKQDLLVATTEYAYEKLTRYRLAQLDKAPAGLERFRALIDLAFDTASMPEGLAVNEVRTGSRSDPDIAEALTPMMSHISNDYGHFLGRHVRQAGLTPDREMRGLTSTVGLAARALVVDGFTHPNPQMIENMTYALKLARERIIARQLGPDTAMTPDEVAEDVANKLKARKKPRKP